MKTVRKRNRNVMQDEGLFSDMLVRFLFVGTFKKKTNTLSPFALKTNN